MIWSKTKLIVFSIIISLFIGTGVAYGNEIDNILIEQDIILKEITTQQQTLDMLSNKYNEAIINKQETEKQITQTEQDIKDTESNLRHSQHQLKKQAINKYKQNDMSIIDVLLESRNFYEFAVNLDFHNKLINQSNEIVQENRNLKDQLATQKEELEVQQTILEQEVRDIEFAQEEANNIIASLQAKYDSLDEEMVKALLQQQMAASISFSTDSIISSAINGSDSNFATYVAQAIAAQTGVSPESIDIGAATASMSTSDLNDIVARAYSMLGSPYSWGGTTSAGFDCSGFVSYCLTGQEGVRLGTTGTFAEWEQVSDPQPGDICVIHNNNSQHTGIYVGDGKMVHAATYGIGVVESNVQPGMTYVRYG